MPTCSDQCYRGCVKIARERFVLRLHLCPLNFQIPAACSLKFVCLSSRLPHVLFQRTLASAPLTAIRDFTARPGGGSWRKQWRTIELKGPAILSSDRTEM
jgi:hypothetical protein